MMKEEAIVSSINITRIGENHHFQMQVPRDSKRIISLEYGAIQKNGDPLPPPFAGENAFKFLPNKIIGRLTLRAAGCEGIFYQGDLIEDQNIHFGEVIAPVNWQPRLWTHGRKKEEIGLSITENSMIYGFFQDSWGAGEYISLTYRLNLYLWIEKCEI